MKPATKMLAGFAKISCGVAICSIPALPHHGDPVGHGQRLQLIMGDDHRGLGQPAEDFLDLAAHLLAQGNVEPAERFVEQEAVRFADDGACNGDALLLALAELVRSTVDDLLQLQRPCDLADTARDFLLAHLL